MTTTWILIAHRGGARLFENNGPGKGMALVENIPHPEGRLKNGEINSDKSGRAFDSFSRRHGMSPNQEATDQVATVFAKHLCDKLDKARSNNRYARLVMVADPRFLGELRATLNKNTAALVSATLDKDLGGVEDRDLPGFLENTVLL